MTAFAAYTDLEARLGITMTAAEQTRAGALLTLATGIIQSETKQTISQVVDDVWTVRSTDAERIRLPERPVTKVSEVTLDGVAIGKDTYYVDGDELVRHSFPVKTEDHFWEVGQGWLGPTYELAVTYTHGYETIPPVVKAICVEMCARVWGNPGMAKAETFGSESVTYGETRGLLLLDHEKEMLADTIGRRSGTVKCR